MISTNELEEAIMRGGCKLVKCYHRQSYEVTAVGESNYTASGDSQETALLGIVMQMSGQFSGGKKHGENK